MKVSSFKEFNQHDIRDILIDLKDDGYGLVVYEKINSIVVEVGQEWGKMIKLNNYSSNFNHLFSYMDEFGYILDGNISYLMNETWDSHHECTNCGNDRVSLEEDDKISCDKCNYFGDYDTENSLYHKIGQGDLEFMIHNKYWVQYMYLYLKKN